MMEQHAQPLPDSMPDLAVRHGPLDTVEAVQSLMQQCEEITVKQHLVTALPILSIVIYCTDELGFLAVMIILCWTYRIL